jgi:flagella basal body P-ring formation protein FlgA
MRALAAALALAAVPALADTLVATRTIRPQEVIAAGDILVIEGEVPGALGDPAAAVGQEALIAIYAGRPIRGGDLGPPAIVERNSLVPLLYASNGLNISTDGRALDRAGAGDTLRVMNLASRTIVTGRVAADGVVHVAATQP